MCDISTSSDDIHFKLPISVLNSGQSDYFYLWDILVHFFFFFAVRISEMRLFRKSIDYFLQILGTGKSTSIIPASNEGPSSLTRTLQRI